MTKPIKTFSIATGCKNKIFKSFYLFVFDYCTTLCIYYSKGVYYEKNCPTDFDDLNHEVALVGYDKDYLF